MNRREFTPEQNKALQLAIAGHSFFLYGKAGTGKLFIIKEIVAQLKERGQNIALVCATGIATTVHPNNLSAATIHSFFGIGDGNAPHNILLKMPLLTGISHKGLVNMGPGPRVLVLVEKGLVNTG